MIINIISTQYDRSTVSGPRKVLINTLKGLDRIGIKYVINQPLNEYKYNWIHDDQKAIIEAGFIGKAVLVGPNTAILPKDLPLFRKKLNKKSTYIHPCLWTVKVWEYLSFNECKLDFWPVGIDTEIFAKVDRTNNKKVLLYFKQRDSSLLKETKSFLNKLDIKYETFHYGFYKEEEYKQALKECLFGIWIGCSESQGIGLQEAMATDLPLIVLNSNSLFDNVPTKSKGYMPYNFPKKLKNIKTSTIPYFDESCGLVIEDIKDLEKTVLKMMDNINSFSPRSFVEENLSLENSAKRFIKFFKDMECNNEVKAKNYQSISKKLFYLGLLFQKWAWYWIWRKILK